jgi:hypothetical protein
MKKIFQDCMIAVIFTAICSVIAAIMGLIERHDKKGDKRRPFGPTVILVYVWNGIRQMIKKFRDNREAHKVQFASEYGVVSEALMRELDKAPVMTMEELEKACADTAEIIPETDDREVITLFD